MSFPGHTTTAHQAVAQGLAEVPGILVRPSEIAALRLDPRHGVEGNEVLFRSGVTVTLSYQTARRLAEKLRDAGELCTSAAHATSAAGAEPLLHIPGK